VYTELKVNLGDISINASQLKPVNWAWTEAWYSDKKSVSPSACIRYISTIVR